MPLVDRRPARHADRSIADGIRGGRRATVSGWGGGHGAPVTVVYTRDAEDLAALVVQRPDLSAIARGLGRSYGDAAQLRGGAVLDTSALKGFALDARAGEVTAQAGVTLVELLRAVVPAGWMLPVVPGTQHVTVGGAIASDVHGKNHAMVGTFGAHVSALGLLTAAGEVLELSPGEDDDLFQATVGGMGLTGVILWARVRLRAVAGAQLTVDTDRVDSLDGALAALRARGGPHRVAWLDLLGARQVRGVVTRARELPDADAETAGGVGTAGSGTAGAAGRDARDRATVRARLTVPARWPRGALSPPTMRAYNELRLRRAPRHGRDQPQDFGVHMFPLDALAQWPRLYGPGGLVQYQFAVPHGHEAALDAVIARLRGSAVPCYLAVLKDLGAANRAPLSFPIEGWTLALDLPGVAPGLEGLLDGFDELVADAGGRVYLTKDARLSPAALEAMYPGLGHWRAVRERADPERRWSSDLGRRTGLVEADPR